MRGRESKVVQLHGLMDKLSRFQVVFMKEEIVISCQTIEMLQLKNLTIHPMHNKTNLRFL